MSWSALQREALEAMGYAVLLPAAVVAPLSSAKAAYAVDDVQTSATPARGADAVAAPALGSGLPNAGDAAAAHQPPVDRLQRALLRAAGCEVDAADGAALIAQWPASDVLRRNPAAKRALWPRLRALRRDGVGA